MNNTLYLRRCRLVWLAQGEHHLPENVVAALLKNIESLGWTLSPAVLERLQTLSSDELTTFYAELVEGLRALVGAHREWKPLYPNFPQQVMEMPEARLYVNAIVHYLSNRRLAFTK
jgi:hypothetical protein